MPSDLPDESLSKLLSEVGPALVLYARTWAGAGEAEDVVQSVFARLLSGGRVPADVRPWLFRCVRNEAISWRRSVRRRLRRERSAGAVEALVFQTRLEDQIDARAAGRALQRLPAVQREIVVLRIWSGLTLAEASVVMKAPVSTLHDQYGRALRAMREQLEMSCLMPKVAEAVKRS